MANKPEKQPSFAEGITLLNERLEHLKVKVSDMRKAGKDPFYADALLRGVRSKIHYYEVTRDPKDGEKVKDILDEAEKELAEEDKRTEITLMDEIEALVKKQIAIQEPAPKNATVEKTKKGAA